MKIPDNLEPRRPRVAPDNRKREIIVVAVIIPFLVGFLMTWVFTSANTARLEAKHAEVQADLHESIRLLGNRSAMLASERDHLRREGERLESEVESATAAAIAIEEDNIALKKRLRDAHSASPAPSRSGTTTRTVSQGQTRTFTLTAYCSCSVCCGPYDGSTTASGTTPRWGTVAGPPSLPFGTKVHIAGLGAFTVEDRGGAIRGDKLDIWFPSHAEALAFGRQTRTVTIQGR